MQLLYLLLALLLIPATVIMLWERVVFAQVPRAWTVYKITGIIGTPVHEIAHAIGCILFGLRITGAALYAPDRRTGRMGYVNFMYRPTSTWQQFGCMVQGVAPLIMGGTIVSLVLDGGWVSPVPPEAGQFWAWLYLAGKETVHTAWNFAGQGGAQALLMLLLVVISMHAIPSIQDVRIGLHGFLMVLIPLLFVMAAIYFAPHFGFYNAMAMRFLQALNWLVMGGLWWLLYAACSVVTLAMAGSLVFILLPAITFRLLGLGRADDTQAEVSVRNSDV